MTIKRYLLLKRVIDAKHNDFVKIITGIRRYEIDFVINLADERIYIQSAYAIPDSEKRAQETFSLRHVSDNFRKVVITGNLHEKPWNDDNGITFIGIVPFLLDPHSLETL